MHEQLRELQERLNDLLSTIDEQQEDSDHLWITDDGSNDISDSDEHTWGVASDHLTDEDEVVSDDDWITEEETEEGDLDDDGSDTGWVTDTDTDTESESEREQNQRIRSRRASLRSRGAIIAYRLEGDVPSSLPDQVTALESLLEDAGELSSIMRGVIG